MVTTTSASEKINSLTVDSSQAPPKAGRATDFSQTTIRKNPTMPATPEATNTEDHSQLPFNPGSSLVTTTEPHVVSTKLPNKNQSLPSYLPTVSTPFKIDRGNVPTPPPSPIPPPNQPSNLQVNGLEPEQEKKVTFLSPTSIFSPRVTRSIGKKTSKANHGLDRNHTAPPSGYAHPEDKAINKLKSPLAEEVITPAKDASANSTKSS